MKRTENFISPLHFLDSRVMVLRRFEQNPCIGRRCRKAEPRSVKKEHEG